jgi:hypothetical protein
MIIGSDFLNSAIFYFLLISQFPEGILIFGCDIFFKLLG